MAFFWFIRAVRPRAPLLFLLSFFFVLYGFPILSQKVREAHLSDFSDACVKVSGVLSDGSAELFSLEGSAHLR